MRFMLTIQVDEAREAGRTDEEGRQLMAAHAAYIEAMKAAGVYLGSAALHPSDEATRLQAVAGQVSVIDGPFTETKEVIGGFYLMEVASREEAIAWAHRCPNAGRDTLELRLVWQLG
jgi:hypothetical protein